MKKIRISAVTAGIIIATVAVAAQVIFGFSHPEAYGVCLVCHGRDMLAQLYQTVFHSRGHLRPYNFRLSNAADDTLRIRRRKGAAGRHSPHAGLRGRHSHTQEAQPQKGLST